MGVAVDEAAIFLVSKEGSLIHGNARADAMIARGEEVGLASAGHLRFRNRDIQERIDAGLRVARPSIESFYAGGGTGSRAYVMPADLAVPLHWQGGPLRRALAPHLILVLASDADRKVTPHDLARKLGLSRAEAEVVLALWEGRTITEIAEARGLSVHTLRNQVKSALSKTGSRRQIDLVALVERVRREG
jgi:DNA-binding CsgD family transcriptional regulator